jgi:hypothetical protein
MTYRNTLMILYCVRLCCVFTIFQRGNIKKYQISILILSTYLFLLISYSYLYDGLSINKSKFIIVNRLHRHQVILDAYDAF